MTMKEALIENFRQLISTHTGLYIRPQDRELLCNKIEMRMKILKISNPEEYYGLLDGKTDQSEQEWKDLEIQITTVESYFFRDRGQFTLLENQILPELIKTKKEARSLRIWSAGCSTGEEVYSLAILLNELIPNHQEWNITIIGTDINVEVLEKAQRGIYNSWSFRLVGADLQNRYFHHQKNLWQIDEKIRQMVKFRYGNLVHDYFPNPIDIHNMDLIICRNVFIYFEHQAIATVLKKFQQTLRPGGYLITGHTELHGQNLGQLEAKVFAESIIYQLRENWLPEISYSHLNNGSLTKSKNLSKQIIDPTLPFAQIPPTKTIQSLGETPVSQPLNSGVLPPQYLTNENPVSPLNLILAETEQFFQHEDYPAAIENAKKMIELDPNYVDAYALVAQAYANLGEYIKAHYYCQLALNLDALSIAPYYLLAHIAEEQGKIEQAKLLFKRIIYLAPSSIYAYLELSSIYEIEGDLTRSRKMRQTALELLQKLPPSTMIKPPTALTAGELLVDISKMLK